MQFENKKRSGRGYRPVKLEGGRRAEQYPHNLQFYTVPPSENISLQEFEDFAVERLKVLRVVETAGIKHIKSSEKYSEYLHSELLGLKKQGTLKNILKPNNKQLGNDEYDDRRKDHISHFILRLAYCRSEDLRRWFIAQEMDLFRFRFCQENNSSIQEFLQHNNLNYKPIAEEEKKSILKELTASSRVHTSFQADNEDYFKVPFTEALDLVRQRRVYLEKGFAYVPHSELVVIILTHFRTHLSHALAVTSRAMPHLEEDGRLVPMLSSLSSAYLGTDYTSKKPVAGTVTADMIEALSRKSFPLCMQQLHNSMRTTHHLKHWGRQQYGLFLKGLGLSMDEAMKFWRTEFTKAMDVDKFDKSYSYGIRHNYGKEGKRTDYTPYSCIKIITSNTPGPGDFHGCPFRHTDPDLLRQKLQSMKISKDALDQISGHLKGGHYQLACGVYFDATHSKDDADIGFTPNHPNQYFDESQMRLNQGTKSSGTPSSQQETPKVVRVQSRMNQSAANTPTSQAKKTPEDDFDDFPMSAEEMELAMQGVE